MMDEKSGRSAEDELAQITRAVQEKFGGEGQAELSERAAGDVTFTVDETIRFFLQGNNNYIFEILRTAFQFKNKGGKLIDDNEQFFEELQEIDEKMFYPIAALNLGFKGQTDLEIEVDQAIWYYEKVADAKFAKVSKAVNGRNHKVMSLLTTQELEKEQILELQGEVELFPNEAGELSKAATDPLKWLVDLELEADESGHNPEDVPDDMEPIVPIDPVSVSVGDLVKIFETSTKRYFLRLLDLADTWVQQGKSPKSTDSTFETAIEKIKPDRVAAIREHKLALTEDQYELAMMFYTQTQNKELKDQLNQLSKKTGPILERLSTVGLTAAEIKEFRDSLS